MKEKYPIGFWNYVSAADQGPEAVSEWADCGMTVAMGPGYDPDNEVARSHMHDIMQEAASRDIKIIHCHNDTVWRAMTKLGLEEYKRRAGAAVEEFGRYSSLMGFHVGDEPDLFMKTDYPDVISSFRTLNELAPGHRHFSNFLPWWHGIEDEIYCPEASYREHLENYVREGGIRQLCYDCYAQMKPNHEGWEQYFRNLYFYKTLSEKLEIPCWTTLLSAGHYNYKAPNEHEYRWQLHTAAAHGMVGVLWFVFYLRQGGGDYHGAPIDEHWERSQSFEWLSRVNRTFNKSLGPVLAKIHHKGTWHIGKAYGGWPPLSKTDPFIQAILSETPFIYSRFEDDRGRPYLLVMNNSPDTAIQAHFRFDPSIKILHRIGWQGEVHEETIHRRYETFSELSKWFMPAQMELYRVELL